MKRKLRDEHHKYSVDFFKQSETSKQKRNFINKKLGNHKQDINVSEVETDGAKTVDKKAICNAFIKSFAEIEKYSGDFVPLNIHKLDHCSENFNFRVLTLKEIYKTIDSLENTKSPVPKFVRAWASKIANTRLVLICNLFLMNILKTVSFQLFINMHLSEQFTKKDQKHKHTTIDRFR